MKLNRPLKRAKPIRTVLQPTRLIDYRTNGDATGIKLLASSDVDKFTGAPQSFKEFIGPMADSAVKTGGSPVVDRIYDQKYAVGGGFTGAYLLWGNLNGSWQQIGVTQNIGFECATIEKDKVPSAIAGTACLDGTEYGRAYVSPSRRDRPLVVSRRLPNRLENLTNN